MIPRRTIASRVGLTGVGLHHGRGVSLDFVPADAGGILFVRTDLPGNPEIPADVGRVSDSTRRTELTGNGATVGTVEHVMAAVYGLGIDDLRVEIDGPEAPIMDGSAAPFCEALARAGWRELRRPARQFRVRRAFRMEVGEAAYEVRPAERLIVAATIEWDHPLIGRQSASLDVTAGTFAAELAPARTFGFLAEAEALRAAGLIKGADETNAVVLSRDGVVGTELRWPNEFARHKALDMLGDLALLGGRLLGEIHAVRPGHRGNLAVTQRIRQEAESVATMDIDDIMAVLPHRYPMLLVDRIVEFEEGKRIVGIKNVTINEPFFQGHFPGHPVMPGVLIVEAMAQTGGMLMMNSVEKPEEKVVYFMSLDKVKFRQPVVPGDQLRLELELVRFRGKTCQMRGVSYVDGKKVAEADMMAAIVDR